VIESRYLYKNDAGSVSFVVQNTNCFEILGDGGGTFCSPPWLASENIDDLFDEYSELETFRNFEPLKTYLTLPTSRFTHKTGKFVLMRI